MKQSATKILERILIFATGAVTFWFMIKFWHSYTILSARARMAEPKFGISCIQKQPYCADSHWSSIAEISQRCPDLKCPDLIVSDRYKFRKLKLKSGQDGIVSIGKFYSDLNFDVWSAVVGDSKIAHCTDPLGIDSDESKLATACQLHSDILTLDK